MADSFARVTRKPAFVELNIATVELAERGTGVRQRQRSHHREAIRIRGAGLEQPVIRGRHELRRETRVFGDSRRRVERQDHRVEPRGGHLGDAEVQPRERIGVVTGADALVERGEDRVRQSIARRDSR